MSRDLKLEEEAATPPAGEKQLKQRKDREQISVSREVRALDNRETNPRPVTGAQ